MPFSAPGWDSDDLKNEVEKFRVPIVEFIGLDFLVVGPSKVVADWTVHDHLLQPAGTIHGGVHATVVETLASLGAAVWLGPGGRVVGVNNATDFLQPVRNGRLRSQATPIHRGRSMQHWLVETIQPPDRLVCQGRVWLQNLHVTS